MQHRARSTWTAAVFCVLCGTAGRAAFPQSSAVTRETAHDIFKQLIEIDTTDSIGSVTLAAQAMAQRLIDAGFPKSEVVVIGPNERKGNMVARYRGRTGSAKLWPGAPVIPTMVTGSSDSIYTMYAGLPSYGISGIAVDRDDLRMHGKDERLKAESLYTGVEFYYEFLKTLTAGRP